MWQLVVLVLSFQGWGAQADQLPPAMLPPEGPRNMVFVSDLHMGVGLVHKAPSRWHSIEDFRWHKEFADFLKEINKFGEGKIDLVIVGDMLELWQSVEKDCEHDEIGEEFGCTESEAVRRTQRVVAQHGAVFSALSDFAGHGDNKVTILPGNHDVALAFKDVRLVVLDGFPDLHSGRIRIADEGYWMSADGKVIAEHGQQIGRDPNKFRGWPTNPFLEKDGKLYLQRPGGEKFIQRIFNLVEHKYPTIDNFSLEFIGVKYVAADRGLIGTLSMLGELVHFILFQTSFYQARQLLGEEGIPIWDLTELRRKLRSSEDRWAFIIESLPHDDPLRATLSESLKKLPELKTFDDDELNSICDRRWAAATLNRDVGIIQCPDTGKLGAFQERIGDLINPRAKNKRYREYLTTLRKSLPQTERPLRDFMYYVYGHTHNEEANYKPFGTHERWAPIVFNCGAWQRKANEQVLCTILKSKRDDLSDVQPEDLPACYPFVTASYNEDGKLSMTLLYWVQKLGQGGAIRADCTDLPEIHPECR